MSCAPGEGCGCGCCEGHPSLLGVRTDQVPGLPAIGYRAGTYGTFRAALVERLARSVQLRPLTTRDDSDHAIALLDSWAYVADIITFYAERGMNESFLRTARLRESIVLLGGQVGYDPSPGLSALAQLAFTVEADARFTLAPGARVQSVPAAGDTAPPVKFETLEAVPLDGALSRVPVLAPAVSNSTPLAAGAVQLWVPPGGALPEEVVDEAELLAWTPGNGTLERKTVVAVTGDGPAGSVTWTPPVQVARQAMAPARRVLRPFGHSAPASFMGTEPPTATEPPRVKLISSPAGGTLGGVTIPYDFAVAAGATTIDLEVAMPDLAVGSELLVASPGASAAVRRKVTGVALSTVRFGPLEATITRLTLDGPLPAFDRRTVALHEVGPDLPLWTQQPAPSIDSGLVIAALPDGSVPERGRAVILTDASGAATHAKVVTTAPAAGLAGHHAITVSPGPATPLEAATAVLLGNVVASSHGLAVHDELLGAGDAAVPFQSFKIAKVPLTRVPAAGAPHGGASTLVVRVDGLQWTERERLYGAAPDARVFVVRVDDSGDHHVQFGDGVQGARLPTGAQVQADYRTGLGTAGNVAAGALRSALTKPKGLRGVANPLAAGGGADAETAEQARENAPNTVRTFGRIVSLQDAEDQARSHALVEKARAAWIRVGLDPAVGLTIAGAGGAVLAVAELDAVRADLDARRDPNQRLVVRGYRPVAVQLEVRVIAAAPDREPEAVRDDVTRALLAHFGFAARRFGQPVRLSEAFVAAQVPGVRGIDIDGLTLASAAERTAHGLSAAPVQERIDLAPDELATLHLPDLQVTGP